MCNKFYIPVIIILCILMKFFGWKDMSSKQNIFPWFKPEDSVCDSANMSTCNYSIDFNKYQIYWFFSEKFSNLIGNIQNSYFVVFQQFDTGDMAAQDGKFFCLTNYINQVVKLSILHLKLTIFKCVVKCLRLFKLLTSLITW